MHGLMHVSGTLALDSREKPGGGSEGGLVFEGGSSLPVPEGRIHLPPPASLPAAVGLNGLRIVPSGINQVQFPCPFPTKRGASACRL
jgi:hypothetical protein